MTPSSDDSPKGASADAWREVYEACESGLRAFLKGRLGQDADVDDCMQAVYIKVMQQSNPIPPGAQRAWLFRVAANEAAVIWRRKSTTRRILKKQASGLQDATIQYDVERLIQAETVDRINELIKRFPDSTQQVLHLRIHDDRTFQEIADQLNIPLGTALTRMRRALKKIRNEIDDQQP